MNAFKQVLPDLKGRTITGYATSSAGGLLEGLTLTFDDGSYVMLSAEPIFEGWIKVGELRRVPLSG